MLFGVDVNMQNSYVIRITALGSACRARMLGHVDPKSTSAFPLCGDVARMCGPEQQLPNAVPHWNHPTAYLKRWTISPLFPLVVMIQYIWGDAKASFENHYKSVQMAWYQRALWSIFSYNFPSLVVVDSDTCTVGKIRLDCVFFFF